MTYSEESYVLDTLMELQEVIRSPDFKRLIKETHENNLMLKAIIRRLNLSAANAGNENNEDFIRNVIANLISSSFDLRQARNRFK